jgi:endonuclease/exonuclease/phosphatase family metal-dependent hydrolase
VHQGFSAGGRLNVERIAEMVRIANPDILALEESDSVRVTSGGVDLVGYLASTLGYFVAYGPPTRVQTYGVSILSRFPIETWDYALLPSPGDQRVVVHAFLRLPTTDLQVFAVHLGLDGAERDAQVAEVLRITSAYTGPRILLGDFNACPTGLCPEAGATPDHVYASVNGSWSDAWFEAHGRFSVLTSYTYDSLYPYERIDYVFVSPGLEVNACTVLGNLPPYQLSFLPLPRDASDHLPVVADVSLG